MPGANGFDQPDSVAEISDPVLRPLLASGVADMRGELGQRLFVPQVNWDVVSVAAFAASGEQVAGQNIFPPTDPKAIVTAWRSRAETFVPVKVHFGDGSTSLIALVEREVARRWPLAHQARAIVEQSEASMIGAWISAPYAATGPAWACETLGLTPLQSKVVTALIRDGDLRLAARRIGVTYATAREALADAMTRSGARRRSELIDCVVCLAFGILPEGSTANDMLMDVWGLSLRQARLSMALAQGASRDEAALSAGVSVAVAKKELAIVFETLGVSSTAGMTAQLAEAAAMSALARLTEDDVHFAFDRSEPLKLLVSPSGNRRIAISDYGPRKGRPVLVLHSSLASRPAPSVLVAALQARGYRPISIDRPGFGLTDPMEGGGDPFARACDDIRTVCDALRIETIDVIARGGAQVAVHFAAQSPGRVGRVVLVAPDPPTRTSMPTRGILGATKRAVQSNPHLMEAFARLFVSNLRRIDTRELVRKAVAASPPDLMVMEDARNVSDYRRGLQMFLSGRVRGYVIEQAALVTEPDPPIPPDTEHWHILVGAHDPLHEPAETEAYWRGLLPGASIKVLPDAGRFIVMSHPGLVADLLSEGEPGGF